MKKILITGGAGFVGSSLARAFIEKDTATTVHVFDNLRRRGSEYNLPLLKKHGIEFFHGDLRNKDDLEELPIHYDLMIDACAEPSVLAGVNGSPNYAISTNLTGTEHSLEFARRRADSFLFLSTSRVYSIPELKKIPLVEDHTRFVVDPASKWANGVDETFAVTGPRSIYGATKLASELLIEEYAHQYGMKAIINRCGVIAGPGQFGKTDQGVFTLWIARHHFGLPLSYTGFGGKGKQVRDLLHPLDLFDLIQKQCAEGSAWNGSVFNAGGGTEVSTSLLEWTKLCERFTEKSVKIASKDETAGVDIPYYITDNAMCIKRFKWKPTRLPEQIVKDTVSWIKNNESLLKELFV